MRILKRGVATSNSGKEKIKSFWNPEIKSEYTHEIILKKKTKKVDLLKMDRSYVKAEKNQPWIKKQTG